MRAYREQCAICRLRHEELLDAAHILPDGHPRGEPVVPNVLALCKLHHAAFDRHVLGVRPATMSPLAVVDGCGRLRHLFTKTDQKFTSLFHILVGVITSCFPIRRGDMKRIPQTRRCILALPVIVAALLVLPPGAAGKKRPERAHQNVAPLSGPTILVARPIPTEAGRSDVGAGVLPVAGGALIAGWTSLGKEASDGLLLRVNPDGDVVWRRQLGGGGTDLLWSILPDPAGGYVCVGFTGSKGAGSLDGWLVHFDADGKVDWKRTYGGTGEDRLTAIQRIPEGWILVGQSSSPGAVGIDGWVLRVDNRGEQLSSWFTGDSPVDRAFGIYPMKDGGCIVAGMTGEDLDKPASFDAFVARLSADGKRVWTHRVRRPGLQVAHDIRPYPDGSVLVTGYGYVDDTQGIDAFAQRLSSAGEVMFEHTFGGKTYDRANHAQILQDGSIVIAGYSQRPGAVDEETGWDLVVYHLDPEGTPISSHRFGGEGYEYGRCAAGVDKDLWIVGHASSGRNGSAVYFSGWTSPRRKTLSQKFFMPPFRLCGTRTRTVAVVVLPDLSEAV